MTKGKAQPHIYIAIVNVKRSPPVGLLRTLTVPLWSRIAFFDDSKTKACSAHLAAASLVDTIEALEEAREVLGRYPYSIVAEDKRPVVGVALSGERDRRALAGIGNGVVGEIAEDTVKQRLTAFDDELAGQIVVKRM